MLCTSESSVSIINGPDCPVLCVISTIHPFWRSKPLIAETEVQCVQHYLNIYDPYVKSYPTYGSQTRKPFSFLFFLHFIFFFLTDPTAKLLFQFLSLSSIRIYFSLHKSKNLNMAKRLIERFALHKENGRQYDFILSHIKQENLKILRKPKIIPRP